MITTVHFFPPHYGTVLNLCNSKSTLTFVLNLFSNNIVQATDKENN